LNLRKRSKTVDDEPESRFSLQELTPDSTLPKGYLSVSQVSMYLKCPKQYEYRYVKGIVIPPGVQMIEGTSHHRAVEHNNERLYRKKKAADREDMKAVFADTFSDSCSQIPKKDWIDSGETKDSVIVRGYKFIDGYMDGVGKSIIPSVEPERKIELTIRGLPVLMFVDVETADRTIDYKVVSSVKSASDAMFDLQLTLYSKATGKRSVAFCCFVKTKTPYIQVVAGIREEGDYKSMEAVFTSVADAIKKGAFPMCSPDKTFPCSSKWCGYYRMCKGKFYTGE
jgi:hypothetical protein